MTKPVPPVPKPEKKPKKKRLSMAQRRKQQIGETATELEILTLFNDYGWRCLGCDDRPAKLTIDHVVPVSRGGSSLIDNIQPLCLSCNIKKGTNTIDFRPLWTDLLNPPSRAQLDVWWHPSNPFEMETAS